jgi:hypothetical protein
MVVVNLTVAFFSLTDMYLLASGAIKVEYPNEGTFSTTFDPVNLELVFRSDFKITNNGFYNLDNIGIVAHLYTQEGKLLIIYRSAGLNVPMFSTKTFNIEARLPLQRAMNLDIKAVLVKGADFVLNVRIDASYVLGLIHFHLDQIRDYPMEAPLPQIEDLLANESLVSKVIEVLKGNFSGIAQLVEGAVFQAFLVQGQEATVSLSSWSELSLTVNGDDLLVKVYLTYPFKTPLLEYDLSLAALKLGSDAP